MPERKRKQMSQLRSYHGDNGRRDEAANRKRRVFTKLLKDPEAVVADTHQAKRFIEGMETFDSKARLLAELRDGRNSGMRRIVDVLSLINSLQDVEDILLPLLGHVLNAETSRPTFRPLRDGILFAIYDVPGLMNALVQYQVARLLNADSARQLCAFLLALCKAILEPRKSEDVSLLSRQLRERGDVQEANILCAFLLVDEEEVDVTVHATAERRRSAPACWVTDRIPPGGRHNNDHLNYRNVQIVPTAEELTCTTQPYLPLASGENNFIRDPVSALLDKNFRLLREDAVSTMRSKIADASSSDIWPNARVIDMKPGARGVFGVFFVIQFDEYARAQINWDRSRKLAQGSIVALCRGDVPIRLGTVVVRETTKDWLNNSDGPMIGVSFDGENDYDSSLEEVIHNRETNMKMLEARKSKLGPPRAITYEKELQSYAMVEVSKSFFAYQPILKTLQAMDSLPLFDELVRPSGATSQVPDYIPPNIRLPRDSNFGRYELNVAAESLDDVVDKTSLDKSQAEALRHCLTSRVALIQGPPGTGKTFIGSLVARVIRENSDESILCVCATNHALDQFLEHMLDGGEDRLVRIGGRTKSERIAKLELRQLSRQKANPHDFGHRRIKQVHAQMHKLRPEIERELEELASPLQWNSPCGGVQEHLRMEQPQNLRFFSAASLSDGFDIVGPGGKKLLPKTLWNLWRDGESLPPWFQPYVGLDVTEDATMFWTISLEQRLEMMNLWKRDILIPVVETLNQLITEYKVLASENEALCRNGQLEVLREARLIGATTAGAARYQELLASKAAGVVIVEEAGEVLEAHVLSALTPPSSGEAETKHLILIGDHKQLPPKAECYNLTTASGNGFELDCSLFERLINAGLSSVSLEVQHRMRPSISELVRLQTYPHLLDHKDVLKYPDVRGASENLIFIDHQHAENGADSEQATSKSNTVEAAYAVEVVKYFLWQGYRCDQIVFLTPYLGQLLAVIDCMKRRLAEVTAFVSDRDLSEIDELAAGNDTRGLDELATQSVRCSSVDNFQGEEADIVVVSLVRSNARGNIGFLSEKQRVNVLLSRARHGLILIGDSATLLRSGKGLLTWGPLIESFREQSRLLKGLPVTCQLHPDDEPELLVSPSDFTRSRPNGGCSRPCTFRMPCGHVCPLLCHPVDQNHQAAKKRCSEPCARFPPECLREHPCRKLCKEECGQCSTMVGPVALECGHVMQKARCHDARSDVSIKLLSSRCDALVEYVFERCHHKSTTQCSNTQLAIPVCPEPCGKRAACEHPCQIPCKTCDGQHRCGDQCQRILFCGHACDRACHSPKPCQPCAKKCAARCPHSSCPKECSVPCASCVEKCDWMCEHQGQCPLVCGAPCSRLPCNKRCDCTMQCGHRCPSLCGEPCPSHSYCQECADAETRSNVVDMIALTSYGDHELDDDPIIVLPCGHFYSVSTLDGILDMADVYEKRKEGDDFVSLRPLRGSSVSEKPKLCPDCRGVLHSIRRYGRLLGLVQLRSLERKHLGMVNIMLHEITEKMMRDPNATCLKLIRAAENSIRKSPMNMVYDACRGAADINRSRPPPGPLIQCLQLKASAYERRASGGDSQDSDISSAEKALLAAIDLADSSSSFRSGAELRIKAARLLIDSSPDPNQVQARVNILMNWVIECTVKFNDLIIHAREIKDSIDKKEVQKKLIREITGALSGRVNDYGGHASDHWFECPNGHAYWIGECGGAMETARCIECGALVGGESHILQSDNRRAGGAIRSAFE